MSNDPLNPTIREVEQRIALLREAVEQQFLAQRLLTDQRFASERERSDATYSALVQLLDQRHAMVSDSLRLQAIEYERRMTVLNHAHEKAVIEQARVLPREMHDAFVREYNVFKDTFSREFSQYRQVTGEELKAIQTRAVTWNAAIGVFFVIVMIAIRFIPMR